MGVGERDRGDQQTADAKYDLPPLEQELGLAFVNVVVEVQRPQEERSASWMRTISAYWFKSMLPDP